MKKPYTMGFAVWMFIVIILSLMPGNKVPGLNWFSIFHIDKIAHLCFYFVMCILMYQSIVRENFVKRLKPRALAYSVIFAFGVGIFMEILQSNLNAGRYFDIFDILANVAGAILAACVIHFKL